MKYRAEVDGLRAVAVVPVIFFHADFRLFSGGFVGVDVFFVISGYLIASILLQEIEEARFSISGFYERRARRILPALFTIALACFPFAWVWMLPAEFKAFCHSFASVSTFTSNILFWLESGYFADTSAVKPLLHTWSLAIEEQFYILFPPLLLFLNSYCRKWIGVLVGVFIVLSLALSQYGSSAFPDANFYLLPTRAWELGIGVLVAFLIHNDMIRLTKMRQELTGCVGFAMIIAAIFAYEKTTPFPSLWALAPVMGTALVLLSTDNKTLVGRILSFPVMVRVGLISYSAYLWHQPLFAFARIRLYENVPVNVYWLLIASTFTLAWLSWKFVEVPARRSCNIPRHKSLFIAAAVCITLTILGLVSVKASNWSVRVPSSVIHFGAWTNNISPVRERCHTKSKEINPHTACILGDGNAPPVYVWGDSHGVELSWELANALKAWQVPLKQLTGTQCQPTLGIRSNREHHCKEFNERVFDYLTQIATPSVIVVIARWNLYFNGSRVDTGEGCIEPGEWGGRFPEGWQGTDEEARVTGLGLKVRNTIASLTKAGHRVVLIHSMPEPGCNVPALLARRSLFGDAEKAPYSSPYKVFEQRKNITEPELAFDDVNVLHIYPEQFFCNKALPDRCISETIEGPIYFDTNHPSLLASRIIATAVTEDLRSRGWLRVVQRP